VEVGDDAMMRMMQMRWTEQRRQQVRATRRAK
jgi:hypothetical protein